MNYKTVKKRHDVLLSKYLLLLMNGATDVYRRLLFTIVMVRFHVTHICRYGVRLSSEETDKIPLGYAVVRRVRRQ